MLNQAIALVVIIFCTKTALKLLISHYTWPAFNLKALIINKLDDFI